MICVDCTQEMGSRSTVSCVRTYVTIDLVRYARETTYFDMNDRCHDCNISNTQGNLHHFGCDVERCPRCQGQLISCGCLVEEDTASNEASIEEAPIGDTSLW